jgi:hypothetical protein
MDFMSYNRVSRRALLQRASCGFGLVALAGLCAEEARASKPAGPLMPKEPHFAARAKRIIFLCMHGGPTHVETFDYKPKLQADDGKTSHKNPNMQYLASQWEFKQRGQSGLWISELFPHVAEHADDLCLLNGCVTDNPNHPQALDQLHTGSFQFIRPSVGAWTLYGLGTENQSLPGFITISPKSGTARQYGSAFLPALYQGTPVGEHGKSISQAVVSNLASPGLTAEEQRAQLELIQKLNRDALARQTVNPKLEGVIEAYELAFRMQNEFPRVMDLKSETEGTLKLYGIDQPATAEFGKQCLLARRFAEAGVRYIEITHGDWDAHGGLQAIMGNNSRATDKPIAGLLADLKQRGLLKDTLVVWGGEFGRTPDDPTRNGRGHNHKGFSMWLCGGGVKGGLAYGKTDDYGFETIDGRVHTHDLHATMLQLMGLDHERLTYRYGGRDFRLTDVHGRVVKEVIG